MTTIEKRHDGVITEIFDSEKLYTAHELSCAKYEKQWQSILSELDALNLPVRDARFSTFCPHLQFFALDALDSKHWPNGISQNSIYVMFKVDMRAGTIEVHSCGHIWLTDEDQKASYLAMCSIKQAHKAIGKSWMRKTRFNDAKSIAKKVKSFWDDVIDTLNDVTLGYPYKQMTRNIYC